MCGEAARGCLIIEVWKTPGTALAEALEKDPSAWVRADAMLAAVSSAWWTAFWEAGATPVIEPLGEDSLELQMLGEFVAHNPFTSTRSPGDRYIPMAKLLLDLVREPAGLPDAIVDGAYQTLCFCSLGHPQVGLAIWQAGFLEVMQAMLKRYSPLERVSRGHLIPTGLFIAWREVTAATREAGLETLETMVESGAVDIAVSSLTAVQHLKAKEASCCVITYDALQILEELRLWTPESAPIVAKLRSAGVDAFRHAINPRL